MRFPAEIVQQLCIAMAKSETINLPRYKELYEALRQQIIDGLLLPGMRLPSSRILASKLQLARNTVIAALEQLCAEGYAASRARSGIYILATAPGNWDPNQIISHQTPLSLSTRGKKMVANSALNPMRGAFVPGLPDLKQFPFELWQRYIARHARNPKLDWQTYTYQGGDLELRATLANYLRAVRSIRCAPEQIIITNGTQLSLQLIANLLADPGDLAWVENPGYPGARCAFQSTGVALINQPVDADGLAPPANAWLQAPKLIYTTPSHQYPTGAVMSASRRRHLLALAAQHGSWVIEDDYDSEFCYEGAPVAAMQALAPNQVIYLGTFSKTFFPAIRLGYIVLPESLVDPFRTTQVRYHREPSYVVQKALADFIREGHATAHIRKMRREYQARRDTLAELLHSELGNKIRLSGLNTGLHLVAHLPPAVSDQAIAAAAKQRGVIVRTLSEYYADDTTLPGLVLGFGDADKHAILNAGKVLCQIIKQALLKPAILV